MKLTMERRQSRRPWSFQSKREWWRIHRKCC